MCISGIIHISFIYKSGYGSPCSSRSVPIKATGSPRSFFATIRCLKGLSKAALFFFQLHIFPCHPSFLIYEFKSDTGHTYHNVKNSIGVPETSLFFPYNLLPERQSPYVRRVHAGFRHPTSQTERTAVPGLLL